MSLKAFTGMNRNPGVLLYVHSVSFGVVMIVNVFHDFSAGGPEEDARGADEGHRRVLLRLW